ncbi:MAG: L,D-transpeptidase family protein [Pseudomonadota bacterium]
MRKSAIAILSQRGFAALVSLLGLLAISHPHASFADDSVTLEIPDHPGIGTVEMPIEAQQAPEPPSQDLMIADAIKVQLNKASLADGQNADDVAALTEFYRTRTGPALWLTTTGFSERGEALLETIAGADDWGLDPTAFPVPPKEYKPGSEEDQATTELAMSLAALRYARAARGGLTEPKSINQIYGHTPTIRPPADVLSELSTSTSPDGVLERLHPKHDQFARLRKALKSAKSENEDLLLRRNMDRWRWMPEELGTSYVWLNIPEFMVHAVEDGKTVQSEKAIVGATGSPTPVLSADMSEIVFNPERIVPSAVIRRDVLPKLRGSGSFFGGTGRTAILDQYGITVKRGGRTVDPKTIDWKTTNLSGLTFVQKPGRTNIMGKVQFLYPNDQKVFMRDTTLRGKFARDIRADGAKEPRIENADKLAARILAATNDANSATVRQQIAGGKTSRVKLNKPMPVHMTYFTAIVGDDGSVKTFGDVYKLDDLPAAAPSTDGASDAPREPINGNLATTSP